nr:hypothetical protein [Tanacetum cinerariifolium]
MNNKSHTLKLENFRDVLQICPKLPGQKFEDPLFEEEIFFFIRDIGHTEEIKVLIDVNVSYMHQTWRSFAAIINRCLSGKTTSLDSLRLSHYFMSKDQSISRRNKMFWYAAKDDPMFNTIRVIFKHHDTQIYEAILIDVLTNQEMLYSKAYKEYYDVASGAEPPKAKTKYKKKADELVTPFKSKSAPTAKGTRLKTPAKMTQSGNKRKSASVPKAKGLVVLSEVAFTEAEQIKLATNRSKKDFHMSHASGSSDGVDIHQNDEDDVEESDMNDDSEETKSDNDGDDLTHPNLSTYKADDEEEEKEKADNDEVSYNQRVYSPPDHELTEEEENKEGDDEDMEDQRKTLKFVSAAGEELTAAKHKLILLELKLFRDAADAAHMK